jgi:hypothetical protein
VNIFSNRQAFTAIKADGSMYSWGNQTGGWNLPAYTWSFVSVNTFSECP